MRASALARLTLRVPQRWLSLVLALAFILGMRMDAHASLRSSGGDAIVHGVESPESSIRTRPSSRLVEQAAPRVDPIGSPPSDVLTLALDLLVSRPWLLLSTHDVRLESVSSWSAQPRAPPV